MLHTSNAMLEFDKKDIELLKNDRSAIFKADISTIQSMMSQEILTLKLKLETMILANTAKKQFIQTQMSEVQGTFSQFPPIIEKLVIKTNKIEETFGKS